MKRWQDRGEVQDSDDEEIGLDAESQSPRRPAKRQRLEDVEPPISGGNDEREGAKGWEQDGAAWLQPSPARTNGRKTGTSEKTELLHATQPDASPEENDSKASATPRQSQVESQSRSYNGRDLANLFTSSDTSKSADLPDVDNIIPDHATGTDLQETEFFAGLDQISSSPLTERETSPSPPPSHRRRSPSNLPSDPLSNQVPSIPDRGLHTDPTIAEQLTRVIQERRHLRVRQEKQLHPYMFEKAQYQQQCRDRGMRPVRVVEAEQQAAETQDAFGGTGESQSSQIVHDHSSSSPIWFDSQLSDAQESTSRARLIRSMDNNSDDDLSDPDTFRRSILAGMQSGSKRRKLLHPKRTKAMSSRPEQTTQTEDREKEFSIPPSPPPTSSDHASNRGSARELATFQMPHGLTPLPLPAPQVSSDIRNGRLENADSDPGDELLSVRSRPSTASKARRQIVSMSSSIESSDTEPEPEPNLQDRGLQREKKRIRGVLPASWLKIDFRAQQRPISPSPSRMRRLTSSSPGRASPQKGVAQRVYGKPTSSTNAGIIDISDDDTSDPNGPESSPSPPRMRQAKLSFEKQPQRNRQQDFADVDEMEVDWIDPMFAGSSRPRDRASTKRRQPKIADAFRSSRAEENDFSEERRGLSSMAGTAKSSKGPKKSRPKSTAQHPKAHRLSILDAPRHEMDTARKLPQFVRLAARNARKRSNNARHSPNDKQIRLATREDTADATSVLREWREGTIAPRQSERSSRSSSGLAHSAHDSVEAVRTPLAETSNNPQKRLPPPLRKESRLSGIATTAVRGPKLQQSRLQPILLDREPASTEIDKNAMSDHTPGQKHKVRRPRPTTARYRGAQLESLEDEFDANHRAAAFERRMQLLTESAARRSNSRIVDVQLQRFLQGPAATDPFSTADAVAAPAFNASKNFDVPGPREALPHRNRKRQARRVDAEAREYRQPSEPLPNIIDIDQVPDEPSNQPHAETVLEGLGPFGTRYATDFDVLPLSVGTYFHESSFIGSGDFAAALDLADRDLDSPTGRITVHVDAEILEWGVWTEEVAVGISRIPPAVRAALHTLSEDEPPSLVLSNVDYLLRSMTRYISRCVAFLDPVDRNSCIQRIMSFVEDLFETVDESGSAKARPEIAARCFLYSVVLARQNVVLCDHQVVARDTEVRCQRLLKQAAHRLARQIFPGCLSDLRSFYEDNRHASKREAGIRDNDTAVASVVVLIHVSTEQGRQPSQFWDTVIQHLAYDSSTMTTVQQFDRAWYDLFTLLPLFEIDAFGIAHIGSRLRGTQEDWGPVRRLIERLFNLYPASSTAHGSTVNEYIRATLTRCYLLVNRWGWRRCELMLGTMFDFFARRGLGQLHKEESRGSPKFLENLANTPSIDVQPDDRSFQIFLKILVSGLIGMRQHSVYSDKKIGGIAWRFIPNHGRTYRKDAEVRQEDLDSLRNHHDLLCALYYATPASHRLRVDLIRNLVDHSASHREACRLSVRAWANLASFQVSTNNGNDSLEPFISWYREIMTTTINQYRLARSEVESEVASAQAKGEPVVPQHVIDDTIVRNQRQISATLVDALAALKRALSSATNLGSASYVLEGTAFWQVFDLFDPTSRRLNSVLDESLAIVHGTLDIQDKFVPSVDSQSSSDESQDYGDSSALMEFASSGPGNESAETSITDLLHAPVGQLISNVFGADTVSDDALLTKIIDAWVRLGQKVVRAGRWSWTHYLSDYSSEAWSQLRDTEQRRKFTPYLLSRIVNTDVLDLHDAPILSWWINSLVEREALLKFQHTLTNSLLNRHGDEILLQNLPFSKPPNSSFNISLHELRQRRLALISSILSNMRQTFDNSLHENPSNLQSLRRDYASILKQVMQAMKTRYQQFDIRSTGPVADVHAQGAYVEFVQQVVSFLQQYTTDICPVDRFFTDSAAFPLPVTDPTYVVGRLRSYVPKLTEARKRKELAVFVKSVSERAAVDSQQEYLVQQLVTAMDGVLERGDPRAPSLRFVLMTAVLPAYVERALSSACSWIVARPVLEVCGQAMGDLFYQVKFEDDGSVRAVAEMVAKLSHAMAWTVGTALMSPALLSLPHVQATLAALFRAAGRSLTIAHHLQQTKKTGQGLGTAINRLFESAASIEATLTIGDEPDPPSLQSVDTDTRCHWQDTLDFTRKQLQDSFTGEWYAQDGRYFVKRGTQSVEVAIAIGDEQEEKARLLGTLRSFQTSYQRVFRGERRRGVVQDRDGLGLGEVVV